MKPKLYKAIPNSGWVFEGWVLCILTVCGEIRFRSYESWDAACSALEGYYTQGRIDYTVPVRPWYN